MAPSDPMVSRIGIPLFVALRGLPWNRSGATFGAYLAALIDRPTLADARVLCVNRTGDMLRGLAERQWTVTHCTAVEPDPVVAAFFWTVSPPEVDIRQAAFEDIAEELADQEPYDVIVVRIDPGSLTETVLATTLRALQRVASDDAALVMTVAMAETTVGGRSAADRLAERGELDALGPYTEYEWQLGVMPLYRRSHFADVADAHGWNLAEVREPHRSWEQHHVLLRRAATSA